MDRTTGLRLLAALVLASAIAFALFMHNSVRDEGISNPAACATDRAGGVNGFTTAMDCEEKYVTVNRSLERIGIVIGGALLAGTLVVVTLPKAGVSSDG